MKKLLSLALLCTCMAAFAQQGPFGDPAFKVSGDIIKIEIETERHNKLDIKDGKEDGSNTPNPMNECEELVQTALRKITYMQGVFLKATECIEDEAVFYGVSAKATVIFKLK